MNRHTHLHRHLLGVTALVASAALVLSGCAQGSSPQAKEHTAESTAKTATGTGSGGTLVIGMTAANLPSADTILSSAQGNEGLRFVGLQLYDGLTRPDLNQSDKTPTAQPDLATSWTPNADATVWTFKLREGVTFTDGTPFNADAVIFNLDRYFNPKFAYTTPAIIGSAASFIPALKSYRAVDENTVEITTGAPDASLAEDAQNLLIASPTAVKKEGAGFGDHPVGTGPFVFDSATSGQMTMLPNKNYWAGAPKLDKLVLKPIPDAAQRTAALRSGSVNWIEAPNPDDIQSLQSSGFQIVTNSYDHMWPWMLNMKSGPLANVKVRQALNFAIDRNAMSKTLLHGTAEPAYQVAPHANSAYDKANDYYSYDQSKAKKLLADAGYPGGFTMTLQFPTAGSGNMEPTPMNEELQADLAKVGVTVKLVPVEWATLLGQYISGKFAPGVDAENLSIPMNQESVWSNAFSTGAPTNAGGYSNPKVDALLAQAKGTIDRDKRFDLIKQASVDITQDAPWLFVVSDRNPRAFSSNVRNFIEPQSWFVDLTHVYVQ